MRVTLDAVRDEADPRLVTRPTSLTRVARDPETAPIARAEILAALAATAGDRHAAARLLRVSYVTLIRACHDVGGLGHADGVGLLEEMAQRWPEGSRRK